MPYKEWEVTRKYYSIGEVAIKLGVEASAIRYWQAEFGLMVHRSGKDRKFTGDDLFKLRVINHLLKVEQYTISGAKRQLSLNRQRWEQKVMGDMHKEAPKEAPMWEFSALTT